jgi:hypothetical protein
LSEVSQSFVRRNIGKRGVASLRFQTVIARNSVVPTLNSAQRGMV